MFTDNEQINIVGCRLQTAFETGHAVHCARRDAHTPLVVHGNLCCCEGLCTVTSVQCSSIVHRFPIYILLCCRYKKITQRHIYRLWCVSVAQSRSNGHDGYYDCTVVLYCTARCGCSPCAHSCVLSTTQKYSSTCDAPCDPLSTRPSLGDATECLPLLFIRLSLHVQKQTVV